MPKYKSSGYQDYPPDVCKFCGGITIATFNEDKPVVGGYHEKCRQTSIQLEKNNK